MQQDDLDLIFTRTLEDGRLSRAERQALGHVLEQGAADPRLRGEYRRKALQTARAALDHPRAAQVLGWLEDVLGLLEADAAAPAQRMYEAHFSPGDACVERIVGLLGAARRSADICVFTITDDRISRAVAAAHKRGVRVRIVTDNEKAYDLGSDIQQLARAGVPVAVDTSPYHMHHKFAIYDGRILLTGSYNWTRGAAEQNEENLVVTDEPRLIAEYSREFERLWDKFSA
jgi:phosphatidylserine/phosphatidylglycerophosphate/cardiolipin synthase-like enzyme